MKITRPIPKEGTKRTKKVFAIWPMWFDHGSLNEPLRTMVWFDYYIVEEYFQYGQWHYGNRRLNE